MLHLLRVIFLHAPHRKAFDSAGRPPSRTAHRMADSNQFYIAKGPPGLTAPAGQEKKPPTRRTPHTLAAPTKGHFLPPGGPAVK